MIQMAPSGVVRSLAQLFAIAHAMEHEAATRYAELATQVRAAGMPDLADLFERLAEEERAHAAKVARWSQQRSGKPPDAADIAWEPPGTIDEEALGELATSRLATAYRVLSIAVRNEERAFAFWSYVAAEVRIAGCAAGCGADGARGAGARLAAPRGAAPSLSRRAAGPSPEASRVSGRILAQAPGLERALARPGRVGGAADRGSSEPRARSRGGIEDYD